MASTVLAEYPSRSKPGQNYQISRDDQGKTWCNCWQWKLHRTCSHLEDFLGSATGKTYKVRKQTVAGKVETYLDLEAAIHQAVQELS
jgi:hypothetical protein